MASVFGSMAIGRGLTTGGASISKALADAAKLKREQEQRMKELDFQKAMQLELEKMREQAGMQQMLAQYGLQALTSAMQQGSLSPADYQSILPSFASPENLSPQTGFGLLGQATYKKRLLDEAKQDENKAFELGLKALEYVTDPSQKQALQEAVDSKDPNKVLAVLSGLTIPWNQVSLQTAKAQAEGATAAAERTKLDAQFFKDTYGDRLQQVKDETRYKGLSADKLAQDMAITAEKWELDKETIAKDNKMKDLLYDYNLAKYEQFLATDPEVRKQAALKTQELEAQIAGRILDNEFAAIRNKQGEENYKEFVATRGIRLGKQLADLAKTSPEMAMQYVKDNKDILKDAGLDPKSVEADAKWWEEVRKYQSPERQAALKVVDVALQTPPPDNPEQALGSILDQLTANGVPEDEAKNLVALVRAKWNGMISDYQAQVASLQAQLEAAKQGGADPLKLLDARRKFLNEQLDALNKKRQTIEAKARTSGCLDSLGRMIDDSKCSPFKDEFNGVITSIDNIFRELGALSGVGATYGGSQAGAGGQPVAPADVEKAVESVRSTIEGAAKSGNPMTGSEAVVAYEQNGVFPNDPWGAFYDLAQSGTIKMRPEDIVDIARRSGNVVPTMKLKEFADLLGISRDQLLSFLKSNGVEVK